MDEREEMRRLISVIEKGAGGASLEQNIEDLRLFANTASFFANKLNSKLKAGRGKRASIKGGVSSAVKQRTTQARQMPQTAQTQPTLPKARSTAISSADYERLRSIQPVPAVSPISMDA